MRYSVLLPTRNGGPFLRNCIASVLDQDRDDVELVVSDNANTDETPDILADYADDPRVRVLRLDQPVAVTENWNAALGASRGDHLLMIGDDDALMPGYFARMDEILERRGAPDCVVYNAYAYMTPNAVGRTQASYYDEALFRFEPDLVHEQELDAARRRRMVADIFRFRPRIPLNMQTTLVARKALGLLRGRFFQPPFPDHYALNVLLLTAPRWVFSPQKLVVVGVSPKSFGHFIHSNQQADGLAYLGMESDFPGRLPGSELINGIHIWLNRLSRDYADRLDGERADRAAYVRRQVYAWLQQRRAGALSNADLAANFGRLGAGDWLGLAASAFDAASWERITRGGADKPGGGAHAGLRALDGVGDIAEFIAWIGRRRAARA